MAVQKYVVRLLTVGALALALTGCVSVPDAIKGSSLGHILPDAMAHLPLSDQGLAWLVPSVVMLGVAVVFDRMLGKPREALA